MINYGYKLIQMCLRCLVLFAVISIRLFVVQAQSEYGYGYIRVTNYGSNTELFIVDPMNPEASLQQRTYPIPDGWILGSPILPGAVSPNREWSATLLAPISGGKGQIQLVNLVSGEARHIIEGHILSNGQSISWSPDGNYLALNVTQGNDDLDIFVYSLRDGQLNNLTNDNFDHQDITWSSDSSWLMTFTRPCAADSVCASRLEVYDIEEEVLINSVDLLEVTLAGSTACNALASQDMRYISFNSNCGFGLAGIGDFPSEILLWDLQSDTLMQITNFAVEAQATEKLFNAVYNQTWLDDETLLVGADYQVSGEQEQHQLLTYDVLDKEPNIRSTIYGADYRINPATQELLVGNYSPLDNTINLQGQTNSIGFSSLGTLTNDAQALNQDVPSSAIDISATCEVQWSPDGTILYATIPAFTEGCQGFVSGVTFINPATQVVQQYDFQSPNDATDFIIPLGWVAR